MRALPSENPAEGDKFALPEPPYSWPGPVRLKVKFRQRAGRADIDLTLSAARDSITLTTSDWACPYEGIIRWLEAIVVGVDECACMVESRGIDRRVGFERYWFETDEAILTVGDWYLKECPPRFAAKVERAQAVHAIYRAFVRFTESPGYDPLAYEAHTVGEYIGSVTGGKYSVEEVLETLVHVDPGQVERFFEKTCPIGMWDASESISKEERWERLFCSMVERNQGLTGPWPIVYKSQWAEVAASLIGRSPAQRREMIRGWLAWNYGHLRGGRLRAQRSPILERFLAERYPTKSSRTANVQSLTEARLLRAVENRQNH